MRARPAASAATVVTAMLVALFMAAVPTRAQDAGDDLGELTIAVVSSNGGAAPRPTGRVFVSADGGGLTLRLARGTERMMSVARTTSDSLAALGTSVTITYSGDSNYDQRGRDGDASNRRAAFYRRSPQGHDATGNRDRVPWRRGALRARRSGRRELFLRRPERSVGGHGVRGPNRRGQRGRHQYGGHVLVYGES